VTFRNSNLQDQAEAQNGNTALGEVELVKKANQNHTDQDGTEQRALYLT